MYAVIALAPSLKRKGYKNAPSNYIYAPCLEITKAALKHTGKGLN